jgi:hypothetical protein
MTVSPFLFGHLCLRDGEARADGTVTVMMSCDNNRVENVKFWVKGTLGRDCEFTQAGTECCESQRREERVGGQTGEQPRRCKPQWPNKKYGRD